MIFFIVINPVSGDEIYNFEDQIDSLSYHHLSFTTLRDLDLRISGSSTGELHILALSNNSYQNWLDLEPYAALLDTTVIDEFDIQLVVSGGFNTSLNFVLHNQGNESIEVKFHLDDKIPVTTETPIQLGIVLLTLLGIQFRKLKANNIA